MVNPVELWLNANTLLFSFNPMPTNIDVSITKSGNMPLELPNQIRPMMFDFISQQRLITIQATLVSVAPYASTPGTGSILDQIEDLMFIMSAGYFNNPAFNNIGSPCINLFVPYPTPMNSTHNLNLRTSYAASGASDSQLDELSVPGPSDVQFGSPRSYADKIYYVYPDGMQISRDEASVNRVHVTLRFVEVFESVTI